MNKPKRTSFIIASALLATSLAAAGCGGGDKAAGGSKETTATTGDSAGGGGGTLIYARGSDSTSLDPQNVTDGESLKVTKNIFDTLVDYKKENTEIIPALATEWKSSPDGKTWTFTLRDGIKFQDGTNFDADAVVFNFERMMDKKNPYHTGGNFDYFPSMFGGFKGEKGAVIKEVKALDKTHVQFTLNTPLAPFLADVAMPCFAIGSPKAIKEEKDKFGQHPVGTGPFKFVSWNANDSITLQKNDGYWEKGAPKLDKLIFKVIPDNTARLTALQNGEIDVMDGLNPSDVPTVKSNSKLQVLYRPSNNIGYLSFNTTKKPFDNPKVRQALYMAINKPALVSAFYAGLGEPAKNPMPPSLLGYNNDVKDYPYDPAAAKKLLAEAGFPNGFSIDFWAMPKARPYMPQPQKIAEAIQGDFNKIGVKTNIVNMEWATYVKKLENGEHTMALFGWQGDNGDPDNFLYVLLDQDNAKPPAAQNVSLYKNQKLHDILIKAQTTPDNKVRENLYKQAQVLIHNDAPMVPLVHSKEALAAGANVKNFIPHMTGTDKFTDVTIEK
ncbi:ABC transporter substrate-binding protein [Aneurinibacillus sp. Ricciae_BoGa-3]|uniref:ABC transporter substrate-binding protein n=1 Tax=Aneurinibacillus sp. Ricciae_BoGa-3 TaxID=3022697 RepID=UPI0023405AB1|nr:ABC transporter substrate-binding protein [Aneurinibacillus sp. Ricciae_BoGa-3]WCK53477.1 ABC transporter substrate-binding protein [Aneurinibacillus sp. Ricciae_BoGa-3]